MRFIILFLLPVVYASYCQEVWEHGCLMHTQFNCRTANTIEILYVQKVVNGTEDTCNIILGENQYKITMVKNQKSWKNDYVECTILPSNYKIRTEWNCIPKVLYTFADFIIGTTMIILFACSILFLILLLTCCISFCNNNKISSLDLKIQLLSKQVKTRFD